MIDHNQKFAKLKLTALIALILASLFFFAAIEDVGAGGACSGCCSHHGGVDWYQCSHGGIGYRCGDGTSLSATCVPCWAVCGEYITPTVTTNAATKVTTTSATLNGDLKKTGAPTEKKHPGYIDCEVWFEYGKTTSYGYSTPEQSKSLAGSFSASISGLDDDTTYHFRAVASSGVGTDYGSDMTFTTEISISHIFDTGPGTYPSIFGTHKGTITPNQTLTVSKLYTYPCSGTGGHTESIEFYESDNLIANGTWNGYHGDYPNITIHSVTGAPYLTLIEDHEYNYTIHTGSYPQICHTDALQTANGWINCTEFVDVNGKRYKDGIPAIRLTHDEETLRIGAFNIQVFGKSKASKPEVMDVLGKIIRTYDVIAIQEIRDKSQTALPALVNTVNSDNSEYDYVVSERLGRTTSKEQYAYIYNTQTVELTDTPYTYPEPAGTDPFHREPYIASFRGGNFDFTLVGIHTKPDPKGTRTYSEISHLTGVVDSISAMNPNEKDIIVLGDFNADGDYFDEDTNTNPFKAPKFRWVITNDMDTMVRTDWTYDRMVMMNATLNHEYVSGSAAVFYFDTEYGISDENLVWNVSDHYPIYAKFRTDLADDD